MKEMIRYGITLSFICAVAAASLATVNLMTKSRIIAQAQAEEGTALKDVLPQVVRFEPIKKDGETLYYKAYDAQGKFSAVAFMAAQKGYSSVIQTMVGMSRDGTISAIKVLSQNETPGLGAGIVSADFCGQFSNKAIDKLGEVQAITGASISSRAVIDSVKNKAQEIMELVRNER